jgi:hypothetical protein
MPIDNKLIDNLLKDYKTPEEILGDNGACSSNLQKPC